MKHHLAIVASLAATFVLGAIVALYGIGPSLTADTTGCFGLRPGYQQRMCMEDAIEYCDEKYGESNRDNFNTCLKSMIGGNLIFDESDKQGEPQNAIVPGTRNNPTGSN